MIAMLPRLALLGACSAPAPLPTDPAPEVGDHAPFTVAVRCVESDVAAHFTEPQAVSGRSNALVHRDAEGRMDGYVLHPDAWWQRLGFEAGDRVRRVNGWVLDSAEHTMEAYRALQDEPVLAVELVRRGQLHLLVLLRDCEALDPALRRGAGM